jgi:anti-anti-sigma factor
VDVVIQLPQAPPHDYLRWVEWCEEVDRFAVSAPEADALAPSPAPGPLASRVAPVHARLTTVQSRTALMQGHSLVAPELAGEGEMWRQSIDYSTRRHGWIEALSGAGIAVPVFPSDLVDLRDRARHSIETRLASAETIPPSGLAVVPRRERGHFRVLGEIAFTTVDQLREVCELELDAGLQLDLSGVEFIDSQGLRLFIRLGLLVSERGGKPVVIQSPSRVVRRLLELTVPRGIPGLRIEGQASEPPSGGE